MLSIAYSEVFPTRGSVLIFLLYMLLSVSHGLLITGSQTKGKLYEYNTILAVLLTEVLKTIMCFCGYSSKYSMVSFFRESIKNIRMLWLYFIPASLYCLYNNLSYINLLTFDPATYFILMQLRVVITGLLFQIIFKNRLSLLQWSSLVLLTLGCMSKNVDLNLWSNSENPIIIINATVGNNQKHDGMGMNAGTILILIQVFCSCFAGVYSEYLLKNNVSNLNIFIQNAFLYFDSIICNILVLLWEWKPNILFLVGIENVFNLPVFAVILNSAFAGIITSFFLKYLNSVLKTVASALELVFVTIMAWIFFGVPITFETIISIGVVSTAILLYTRNPVKNYLSIDSTRLDAA